MKYLRTKDGRLAEVKPNMIVKSSKYGTRLVYKDKPFLCVLPGNDEIFKQADTIDELCDEFVVMESLHHIAYIGRTLSEAIDYCANNNLKITKIRGAICTEWGLKYVAELNEKGKWKRKLL